MRAIHLGSNVPIFMSPDLSKIFPTFELRFTTELQINIGSLYQQSLNLKITAMTTLEILIKYAVSSLFNDSCTFTAVYV